LASKIVGCPACAEHCGLVWPKNWKWKYTLLICSPDNIQIRFAFWFVLRMIKQLIRRLISVSIWLLPCFHFWLECLGKYLQSVAFQLWENCFFSIHSAAKPKIFAFPMAITNAFCTHQRHILSIHIPIDTRGRFRMQVNAECYLSGRTEKKVKIIMKCIGISLTYPQSTSIKLKCNHHAGVAFQYFVMHLTMLITKSNAINMAFFAPFRSCCKQFLHFACGHIFQLGFGWL